MTPSFRPAQPPSPASPACQPLIIDTGPVLPPCAGRGAAGLLPGGEAQPAEFAGARVVEAGSFPCPGYSTVPLSLGLSPRIFNEVRCGAEGSA